MKKYEVIEDTGGGITLIVFGKNGEVEYFHSGYEYFYTPGQLLADLESIKNGANPAQDWDGNEEKPQEAYDLMKSYEFWGEVVANSNGIYKNKMGSESKRQFGIEEEEE